MYPLDVLLLFRDITMMYLCCAREDEKRHRNTDRLAQDTFGYLCVGGCFRVQARTITHAMHEHEQACDQSVKDKYMSNLCARG